MGSIEKGAQPHAPLIRDAHAYDVTLFVLAARLEPFHGLVHALETGIEEVRRLLLHPSAVRVDLLEFLLVRGDDLEREMNMQGESAGRRRGICAGRAAVSVSVSGSGQVMVSGAAPP